MSKPLRNSLIALAILVAVIITWLIVSSIKNNLLVKETILRTESEMRFKQLVKEQAILVATKDSIESVIAQKQTLIDYLENNPQTIIQQNNDTHLSIDKLNAINTALLWTNNLTEYENSRERYSLLRFGKKSSQ